MKHPKILFSCMIALLTWFGQYTFAQPGEYAYKREILWKLKNDSTIRDPFYLTDDMYEKLNADLSDIRIYGFTENNDTTEISYIINSPTYLATEVKELLDISEPLYANGEYYFTIKSKFAIDEMQLHFEQKNFDWRIKLEEVEKICQGDTEYTELKTILDDYRILSIKNDLTDYQFTTLKFPQHKARTFRLSIKSDSKPELLSATWSAPTKEDDRRKQNQYTNASFATTYDKQKKQTVIHVSLPHLVPVSNLCVYVKDPAEYYRPFTVTYTTDSVKTRKGWHHNYNTPVRGTLSSFSEENEIHFNKNILLKNFTITISEGDNHPLTIDSVSVYGHKYAIQGKIYDPAADYFIYYGNEQAGKPDYDYHYFMDQLWFLTGDTFLGDEIVLKQTEEPQEEETSPFENEIVLWSLIGLIIFTLGWFSLKMIKKSGEQDND